MPRYTRRYSKDLVAAVHVRLAAHVDERLAAAAAREGSTRPELVRQAVAWYLEQLATGRAQEVVR